MEGDLATDPRDTTNRRPLKSRGTRWAVFLAGVLARRGVKPDTISLASVLFAALSALALSSLSYTTVRWQLVALCLSAAACIQLRLLCNLLDGMVAVEHDAKSASGEVFNDLPDRVSDVLILVAAGYATGSEGWGPVLGWSAAVLSVLTAYNRVLGASLGVGHWFAGPMAKPHRMATLTAALLLSAIECVWAFSGRFLLLALGVIVLGALITCCRRTVRIVRSLERGA